MTRFRRGEPVIFESSKTGRKFDAVVADHKVIGGKIEIKLYNDPYSVPVLVSQLTRKGEQVTATPTRSPAMRRLAKEAKELGIRGWQRMKPETLKAAVAEAQGGGTVSADETPVKRGRGRPRKATAPVRKARGRPRKVVETDETPVKRGRGRPRKVVSETEEVEEAPVRRGPGRPRKNATAAKTAKRGPGRPRKAASTGTGTAKRTRTASVSNNGANPFRAGSNAHTMTEELLKGGKRSDMIKRLKKTITITAWSESGKEVETDTAIDKRIMITAGILEKDHGFTLVKEGRGTSGTLQAVPPKRSRTKA